LSQPAATSTTRRSVAVGAAAWQDAENSDDASVVVAVEPDSPIADTQPPFGRLDAGQPFDVALSRFGA
jgi:hypothetical protein